MKKLVLLSAALLLFANVNFAQRKIKQSVIKRCSTYEKMMEIRALDPDAYDKNKAKQEQILQNRIANNYNSKSQTVYTIPVVVQIFGTTANNAVTDNRVNEQVAVLTEDYRRLNSDTNNTPTAFKSIAADIEFEFCLATIDPQGNATTGIVRKTSANTPQQSDLWNTTQYLNLLVYDLGGGLLGYTYLPSNAPDNGVHISYQYFGKTGASAPFNKGRTATHEVGHWFNLEHIWGDDQDSDPTTCSANECSGSDYVNDTPNQAGEHYGCKTHPLHANICSGSPDGEMFMNYMDYVDDNCMNMFSAGQKARMVAAILQYRPSLFNNGKCGTSSNPPTAAFTANQTTIAVGACVNFTNQSTGTPTTYAWTFQGGNPATSTQQNPSNVCYSAEGCYNVTLIVSNTNGSDTLAQTCYINVVTQVTQVCDTVSNYKTTDTPSLPGSGGWGYVTGHNDYDDRAKADYFTATPAGYEITGAKFWFGKTYDGSGTSTIEVSIWGDNAGSPGSALYTQTVPISQLQVYPNETFINFTTPQTVIGNYYLGIQIAANGTPQDTVALISNADGETSPGTAWEYWSDNTWHAMSETPASWGLNISQAIWALRCPADTGATCNVSASATTTNASCGQSDGTATVTATGGANPYTYLWSNGQTGATATGLAAGNYSVVVTDSSSCTATATASVNNTNGPSVTVASTNASCGQSDGTSTITATGGTTPYSYLWSNGQTGATATGLAAGNYSVAVTDSSSCTAATTASVSNTNGPSATIASTNCSVVGACDGTATVTATGGATPYTYLWSDSSTTASISGLCAGSYSVIVTDSAGCAASSSVTITEPVGIANVLQNQGVSIFPNPNNGVFTVFASQFTIERINVFDVIGNLVYQTMPENRKPKTLHLSSLPQGMYFVVISSGETTVVRKISVMK